MMAERVRSNKQVRDIVNGTSDSDSCKSECSRHLSSQNGSGPPLPSISQITTRGLADHQLPVPRTTCPLLLLLFRESPEIILPVREGAGGI